MHRFIEGIPTQQGKIERRTPSSTQTAQAALDAYIQKVRAQLPLSQEEQELFILGELQLEISDLLPSARMLASLLNAGAAEDDLEYLIDNCLEKSVAFVTQSINNKVKVTRRKVRHQVQSWLSFLINDQRTATKIAKNEGDAVLSDPRILAGYAQIMFGIR